MANPISDFSVIILRANDFIFMSLLEYEMTSFKYSSIALASLLYVLNELEYKNFSISLIDLI